jgi:hypothetical protein
LVIYFRYQLNYTIWSKVDSDSEIMNKICFVCDNIFYTDIFWYNIKKSFHSRIKRYSSAICPVLQIWHIISSFGVFLECWLPSSAYETFFKLSDKERDYIAYTYTFLCIFKKYKLDFSVEISCFWQFRYIKWNSH